ncbi:MAG: IspD/TarI family cytidylyltransferase [Candidatus Limnocylindrus sp.]|jgi:2-C-methyl-D-erythritol 4-phosphate cytidylyltransferase
MSIGMVLLAGGVGKRMGKPAPKQFLLLGGKPLIIHVAEAISGVDSIGEIVVTCPAEHIDDTAALLRNHGLDRRIRCVAGGASRQESVRLGLAALSACDTVIIHEAVRPLVSTAEFQALIADAAPNAFYGIPIPFTVLRGRGKVEGILDRDELVNVQLPQKFAYTPLVKAHAEAAAAGESYTEDASLFYARGAGEVKILKGSERNLKITHPSDLITAEALYADWRGGGG